MTNRMSNIELKDLIELHLQAIREEIKAGNIMSEYKFDEMIAHQKVTNGRVNVLEEHVEELQHKVSLYDWLKTNWKWTIAIGVFVWFILHSMSDVFTIQEIVKLFK